MAGLLAGLVLLVAAAAPAYAKDYTVGDSSGWTSGMDYSTWAKGKTFHVGDTLLFQYSFMHTVAEVSSPDYSACSASNSIQSYSDQNTKITLTKPGARYFICGTSGHCANGMKLAVTVSPSSTNPSSPPATPTPAPTTPSTTPSTPGTETPSTTTPSTPTPAATEPAATTPSTTKSSRSASGATDSGAHSVMGLWFGAMGLLGLALMG